MLARLLRSLTRINLNALKPEVWTPRKSVTWLSGMMVSVTTKDSHRRPAEVAPRQLLSTRIQIGIKETNS